MNILHVTVVVFVFVSTSCKLVVCRKEKYHLTVTQSRPDQCRPVQWLPVTCGPGGGRRNTEIFNVLVLVVCTGPALSDLSPLQTGLTGTDVS